MAEIIEAGSIELDREQPKVVDAGSIELDKPTAKGPTIQSWEGPSFMDKVFSLFDNPEKESAKAVQALVDSEALGISPSAAYRYRDQIDQGVKINPQAAMKRSTLTQRVKQSFDTGVKQNQVGELGYQYIMTGDPKYLDAINKVGMPGEADTFISEGRVESAIRSAAKMLPMMADTAVESAGTGLTMGMAFGGTAAILGQLGPQAALPEEIATVPAATLAGFTIGATAKAFESSLRKEAGLALSEIINFKDAQGKQIDPNIARAASFGIGAINGAIEVAQIGKLLKTVPGLDKLFSKAVLETVASKTVKQKLLGLSTAYAGTVGTETGQEVAQESTNIVFEELAKKVNNAVKGTDIQPSTVSDIIGRLQATAIEAAQGFTVMAAPGTVVKAGMAAVPQPQKKAAPVPATPQAGLAGIAKVESGGDYAAQHAKTGAFGKYQIMPSNWGPWAKEAGLSADAPMTPENQETVANFKWNQYMTRYGDDQLAATAWFAGPGAAQRLMNGDMTVLEKQDANGTTVAQYIQKTTGREFGLEGTAQQATVQPVDIDEVITRAIETDDDIDQIANDFFEGVISDDETQMQGQERGQEIALQGLGEETPAVMPQIQENVTTGQADVNLTALIMEKAKAINATIGEKGSIDLTPIVELGRSVYQQGARTYEQFSARVKEFVGNAWDKVKDLVRQAWDVISNESGKISFDKKDKSGKIKDAVKQTPSETGPESIATMEGAEKDAISAGYNKAEAEAVEQLKQSQSFEEFEKTIEKADFGDTSMESPLERGMTLPELKAYRKSIAENPQIEKMKAAIQSYRSALKELGKKMKMANKDEVASLKGQIRELKATREDIKKSYSSVKARIREITGQMKGPKTVTEYDALKASFVKAARAAREAYRAGNKEGVEKAKTQMKEAYAKAQEKRQANEQRAKDLKAIKKLSQMKGSIAVDYQKKIRDLMEGIDFKNISAAKWEQLKALQDFIESEGVPLGINPKRLDELKRLTAIPLKSLDNEQIAMLRKQLEELTALGKLKASLKYKYNERKRADLERKILETTRNLDPSVQFEKGELRRRDKMKVASVAMYLNTMHTPRVADLADGYNDYKGEQARLIKSAGEAETRAVANATKRQHGWLDFLRENKIELPTEGSESDIRMNIVIRMLEGATKPAEMLMKEYGVSEVPTLTDEENKIIEYIRQDMDRQKGKLAATWEEINEEIFPEQKVYYLPLKYVGEEELLPETQTEGRGRTTHTFDGFSHARRPNVNKLPRVGIAKLYQEATMEQEWFTGLQPIVEDIKSVVLTPAYKERAGSILYDWWKTQLDIMSRRGWTASAQMTALSSALATIRHNITTATLAFKLSTVIMQPMAVFDAMSYVNSYYGPVAAAKVAGAVAESFLRPGWTKGIVEGSEALKQRAAGELAIQEELSRLDDTVMDKVKRAGFNMIQWTDIKTAAGVQEQVRKILLAEGMNEDEALKEAEFVMHLSQGSTSVAYRPHILAQGEGYRTWFTFQNFVLNRWGIMIHDIVNGKIINGKGISARILGMVSLGILVAGGMAEDEARRKVKQIYTSPKEDKRSMFEQIIVNVLGAIPFFGSFVTAVSQKFDAQPPTISHVQKTIEGAFQTVKGKDTTSKVKGGLKLSEALATIFLGIPGTGQIFDLIESATKDDDRRNR